LGGGGGGKLGNGRQWVSWIHVEDEAALALELVENETIHGPVNGTAPNPVRNEDFTRALAARVGRPAFFRVPAIALRMAAGGFAGELLESRRILPAAAGKAGFRFRYPEVEGALLKESTEGG
jgi:NAD dependent epimerase/dehydratase family enzyme